MSYWGIILGIQRIERRFKMTIVPMYKICPRCKRRYQWNPDIGKMWCPFCGPRTILGMGDIPWIRKIFKK